MAANPALRMERLEQGFDLAGFDLNLLIVLNALLRHRNITHAGNEVKLSQPAISRALSRLRQLFDNELLVRRNRSFELTPLAEMLAPKVEAALANIGNVFSNRFPIAERFAIAMPDHLALRLIGNLTGYFRQISPTTTVLPVLELSNVLSQLENGQLDLALGIADDAPLGFFCRMLPAVPTLCVSRKGHAATNGHIPYSELGRFLSIRIGAIHNAGFGEVHDGLEVLRPRGRETITVPDIHTAARLIQDTDAVLVLPASSARYVADRHGLQTFVPVKAADMPAYQISIIWHERWHRSSVHAGVRSMIASNLIDGTMLAN